MFREVVDGEGWLKLIAMFLGLTLFLGFQVIRAPFWALERLFFGLAWATDAGTKLLLKVPETPPREEVSGVYP